MKKEFIKKGLIKKAASLILATTFLGASLIGCGANATGSNDGVSGSATVDQNSNTAVATDNNDKSAKTKITIATKGSPAPYMVVDENNNIGGSDIDIVKAVFERLPQYEIEIVKADDPLTGLTSGLYDLAVNNYGWREERGEVYYYSFPYKVGYNVFIQRTGDEPIKDLKDLADRGYKTEVAAGSLKAVALEKWNEQNPDHKINLVYSEADFQAKFNNIVDGKTDVAIDDGPILDTLIDRFGLSDKLVGNPLSEETEQFLSQHNGSYFLFAKDDKGAALREEVNKVIKELKADGTLAKILTGYFGKDTSPSDSQYEKTLN